MEAVLREARPPQGSPAAGLYIHVPFCRKRCPFCDFAITTDLGKAQAWEEAVVMEMDLRAPAWAIPFDTVYFGGGTPSRVRPEVIGRLLEAARARFAVAPDAEVTLEANPDDLGPRDLEQLREDGVDRLSIGIQSFHPEDLVFLGRTHSVEDSVRTFRDARAAGFANISLDLLYGIPGSDRERLVESIRRTAGLGPEHISAYQLTRESGTVMSHRMEKGEIDELTDAQAQELFLFVREELAAAGFPQFEVSSYPRSPQFESRHNRKYWEGAPYLGLGPAAHSYRDPERSWNAAHIAQYLASMAAGGVPVGGKEILGPEQKAMERIFLGLRMARGLDLHAFERDFGWDLRAARRQEIGVIQEEGLAVMEEGRLRLTPRGLALADEIALRLSGPAPQCRVAGGEP